MKTLEDFKHDRWEALKAMRDLLESKGYEVDVFFNMDDGNDTLTVQVEDEEHKEQVGYAAVFRKVSRKENNVEKLYNELTMKCATSVREYFMVLRLAIYHIDGEYIETSADIAQYEKTEEVYKQAIKILLALNERRIRC